MWYMASIYAGAAKEFVVAPSLFKVGRAFLPAVFHTSRATHTLLLHAGVPSGMREVTMRNGEVVDAREIPPDELDSSDCDTDDASGTTTDEEGEDGAA